MSLLFSLAGLSLYQHGFVNLCCVAVIMALSCIKLCAVEKEVGNFPKKEKEGCNA
jgi:hypothetical protein